MARLFALVYDRCTRSGERAGMARWRSGLLASADALPVADDSFDAVVSTLVLCSVREAMTWAPPLVRPTVRGVARCPA